MTTSEENAISIAALQEQMREMLESINDFARAIDPLKLKHDAFQAEKDNAAQEYYARIAKVDEEKVKVDKMMREIKREEERIRREAEQLQMKIDQALAVEKSEAELKVLEDRWNSLTAGAPWREFAFDHQLNASDKMVFNRRVALCDVMGLGKTLTAIVTCDKIKAGTSEGDVWWEDQKNGWGEIVGTVEHRDSPAGRHILYLAPAELVRNVEPEWKKWAPHRQPKILAKRNKIQREVILEAISDVKEMGNDTLVLCNYEAWRKDERFLDQMIELGFDTIILDEAHVLKDRDSNAYRGVKRILRGIDRDGRRLADPVRFVFPMTGTPFLNRPQELYSILTLVDSKIFHDTMSGERSFLRNYCEQYDTNKWRFRPGGIDELAKLISNRYIRRTLKDAGIELPPQTVTIHELDVDEEKYADQAKAREQMRSAAKLVISESHAIVATIMLTVYLRLRQIETWPAGIKLRDGNGNVAAEVNVYESQKMDYIIDNKGEGLLSEVCPDQRTVVFSQFAEPLAIMAERAKREGMRAIVLDGSTPQNVRDEIKVDFDRSRCREGGREPKWDVLFANYKVGGIGLNLTDATQIIALDEEWNPGKAEQAFGRVNRIGQTEQTAVHIIRMANTIDSWLAGIIEAKKNLTGDFNQAMDKQSFLEAMDKGEI
jgi:SNF2 family DNA or RNA helicase